MTKIERQRVSALLQATDYLFLENLALTLVMEKRDVPNWRSLADKLLADEGILGGAHLRFKDIYAELRHSDDPLAARERSLTGLPSNRKPN